MRELWIGQQYAGDLRECTYISDEEQSVFYATDEQAREFAVENADPWKENYGHTNFR